MIKGVILAGGQGTRLRPFTHLINKHLLPVYDKPLIYYPLLIMRGAGITDILLTSDKAALPSFRTLLNDGSELGLRITYAAQDNPKGIADALGLAERFAENSKIAVMLGDNIFTDHEQIAKCVTEFGQGSGARLFLKEVPDPERFGVAQVSGSKIVSIVEKPEDPRSNLAVTGLYLYDPDVFAVIKSLKPSKRGELEITDVNNYYIDKGLAKHEIVRGEWIDAGTFDSLAHASNLMFTMSAEREKRRKIGGRGFRKLTASSFRAGSQLLRGSALSRLPLVRSIKKGLLQYLKRRVPPFTIVDGHILFLDERDRLELSTRGSFESYKATMMKKLVHPGDTVLDIGAHIGYHALALARLVGDNGKVIALEPDPVNFSLLEKNIRVNQYSNVTAFRTKISGRTSDAANGSDGGSISTGAITVDDFVHDRLNDTVDLIQFDVDGRECFAPQGMPSTLKKDALILLAEHDPAEVRIMGYDPERDFAFLRSNGFEIYSLHDRSNGIAKVTDVRQMAGKNLICIKGRRKTLLER